MTASSAPASDEKAKEAPKPVVAGADQTDEVEDEGGDEQQTNVQAATDLADPNNAKLATATSDATAAGRVIPKATVETDGSIVIPAVEEKRGFFGRMWDGVTRVADSVVSGLKSAWDSAAGVVDNVLNNDWKKEFGKEAEIKTVKTDGKITSATATDNGNVYTWDGKQTTRKDKFGNTVVHDSATNEVKMTDKDGGKYSVDKATGDAIYIGADGTKIVQHKDGTKEFLTKDGKRIEQAGEELRIRGRVLDRFISKDGIVDEITIKGEKFKTYSHGDVTPESVPVEKRSQPGHHRYRGEEQDVDRDGTTTTKDNQGRTFIGDCYNSRQWEVKTGEDGKLEFWRNGKKHTIDDVPERVRKRFEAQQRGTGETHVDGIRQVIIATGPDGKQTTTVGGAVSMTATETGIKSVVNSDKGPLTYENRNDGRQTAPDADGKKDEVLVYDSNNKTEPFAQYKVLPNGELGEKVLTFNPETQKLWTPEFESTPEGTRLANGNFIGSDGTVSNSDGKVLMGSNGSYGPSSPEYQTATTQAVMAVNNIGGIIMQAKSDPKGMSEGAIEGAISDLGRALALCFKTGNYEKLNQIFGAISEAYGALALVKYAKAEEQRKQGLVQAAENDFDRLNVNRVA